MKKAAISCIISAILLFSSNITVSAAKLIQFSNSKSKILMSSSSSFTELPSKSNVKLDKSWTITFSNNIDMNKIDGILVQKDSDFVPVTITISGKNTISVKPINSYVTNSKYTLKIFLSNGTKYSMDFTTEDAYKTVDSENNDSYMTADTVSLGDKLNGSLDDKTNNSDWYKLVVPKDANITISAKNTTDTNAIDLFVYGKDGDNNHSIADDYYNPKSERHISKTLDKGIYYIRVTSNNNNPSVYTLTTN